MDKKSKGKHTRHRSQRLRIQLDGNVLSSASTSQSRTSVENNEIPSSIQTATQSETDTTKRHSASADADISMETSLPIGESQAHTSLSSPSAGTSATPNSPPGPTSPPASPEPNCPICLGKLENKSFTNSCFHMFCFLCLVEWSKVKAECPLCKQSFKSIVHNVRSDLDYDEYYIQQPERIERPTNEFTFSGGRFRYRTTVTDHRYTRQAEVREREERLLSRPSLRQPTTNWRRLRQPATSDFRQRVYQNRLKAVDSSSTNTRRRVRETSPSFFRENVAQTHRLVPWLNRELNAVLHGHGEQIAFVLELIMGLIKRYPIDSEEFYEHTYPFIGRHTRQFQQEFLRFARSAYHMAAYDRHTIYEPNTDPPNYDSDDEQRPPEENDSDVIVVSPSHSPQQQRRDNAPMRVPAWESTSRYLDSILSRTQTWMNHHIQANTDPNHMQQHIQRSTEASGWDSPIHSPGWNIPTDSSSEDVDIVNTDPSTSHISSSTATCTSSFLSPVNMQYPTFSMLYPSSTFSIDSAANPYNNLTHLTHCLPPVVSSFQLPACTAPPPLPAIPSTSIEFPINVDQVDSDSNESDVMIVDYEKPWLERSPIQLSSAESDFDVRITGEHRPGDPEVKHERSRKRPRPKEKEEQVETIVNQQAVPNSRQPETAGDVASKSRSMSYHSHSKRQRHHTISSSDEEKLHRDPLILKLLDIPHYKHKKYSKIRRDKSVHRHSKDLWHSPESFTSQSSGDSSHKRSHTSSSISGSESRVSIRSNKHRTTHSSIKIVEYHKHNRKHKKKHKKRKHSDEHHSRKDKERHSSHSRQRKLSKSDKSGHSHKRHESKKQPLHSDTIDDKRNITRTITPSWYSDDSVTVDYAEANLGTNDSCKLTNHNQTEKSGQDALKVNNEGNKNANKPIDFSTYYDKLLNLDAVDSSRISTASVRTAPVDVGNFDIVELPLDTAGYFDKDLELIAKTLAAPEHETCNTKTFKKHPHGHKKSRKTDHSATDIDNTGKTVMEEVVNIIDQESTVAGTDTNREENIQSNLISSCTEVFECTDSKISNVGQISTAELSHGSSACLYRTCASPVNIQSTCKFIDVDTISENSDVDIITCADNTDILAYASRRTRKDTPMHVDTTADIIDVVGVSDDETRENVERDAEIKYQNDYIDVLGCSDSESMSSSQNNYLVEVIKSSTENLDITSVSDDENIKNSKVIAGFDLNALENADNDMCGKDADLTSKSSTYLSNDVISTETTALTDEENLNVVNDAADETGFIKPVETTTELCSSALATNTEIMSRSEVNPFNTK